MEHPVGALVNDDPVILRFGSLLLSSDVPTFSDATSPHGALHPICCIQGATTIEVSNRIEAAIETTAVIEGSCIDNTCRRGVIE